jgi:hypothetical protein
VKVVVGTAHCRFVGTVLCSRPMLTDSIAFVCVIPIVTAMLQCCCKRCPACPTMTKHEFRALFVALRATTHLGSGTVYIVSTACALSFVT